MASQTGVYPLFPSAPEGTLVDLQVERVFRAVKTGKRGRPPKSSEETVVIAWDFDPRATTKKTVEKLCGGSCYRVTGLDASGQETQYVTEWIAEGEPVTPKRPADPADLATIPPLQETESGHIGFTALGPILSTAVTLHREASLGEVQRTNERALAEVIRVNELNTRLMAALLDSVGTTKELAVAALESQKDNALNVLRSEMNAWKKEVGTTRTTLETVKDEKAALELAKAKKDSALDGAMLSVAKDIPGTLKALQEFIGDAVNGFSRMKEAAKAAEEASRQVKVEVIESQPAPPTPSPEMNGSPAATPIEAPSESAPVGSA